MQERVIRLLEERQSFTVAVADIDSFGVLNDQHGREVGDRALQTAGQVARRAIRPDDIVGRIGGDELLFIFPRTQLQSFWMKNCIMDIDLAYIDDDGKIVDIHRMKALPKGFTGQPPRYPSSTEVRYVLEMADGWFEAHGVKVGDTVEGYTGPAGVRVR